MPSDPVEHFSGGESAPGDEGDRRLEEIPLRIARRMMGDHETAVFILRLADALPAAEMKEESNLPEFLARQEQEGVGIDSKIYTFVQGLLMK